MEKQPSLESKALANKRRPAPSASRSASPASVTAPPRDTSGRPPRPLSDELAVVTTPAPAAAPTPSSDIAEYENEEDTFDDEYKKSKAGAEGSDGRSSSTQTGKTTSTARPSLFRRHLEATSTEASKSELRRYLDEPNVDPDDTTFVLLDWWKVNTRRFPVISRMARRFLTIPATSVSSESTFSTGGRVLDDYRSSLLPAMVERLVCASSWLRGSANKSPKVVVKDDDDVELIPFPECVVESS